MQDAGKERKVRPYTGGRGPPKGYRHTKEAKRKMRESRKGKPSWNKGLTKETDKRVRKQGMKGRRSKHKGKTYEEIYGEKRANTIKRKMSKSLVGKKLSKETKAKMSKARSGPLHYNYIDGRSQIKNPYPTKWTDKLKKAIRKRDNSCCQFPGCGIPENGASHAVHHINHDKADCRPENLITLCQGHNITVERNDMVYWTIYFMNEMKRRFKLNTPESYDFLKKHR